MFVQRDGEKTGPHRRDWRFLPLLAALNCMSVNRHLHQVPAPTIPVLHIPTQTNNCSITGTSLIYQDGDQRIEIPNIIRLGDRIKAIYCGQTPFIILANAVVAGIRSNDHTYGARVNLVGETIISSLSFEPNVYVLTQSGFFLSFSVDGESIGAARLGTVPRAIETSNTRLVRVGNYLLYGPVVYRETGLMGYIDLRNGDSAIFAVRYSGELLRVLGMRQYGASAVISTEDNRDFLLTINQNIGTAGLEQVFVQR